MMRKKILVYGSCVTRDAFSLEETSAFELCGYYARSSFASSCASLPIEVGPWIYDNKSNFQQQMIRQDFEKTFFINLYELLTGIDYIVIDMIDERFDLYKLENDSLYTITNELTATSLVHKSGRIIPRMSNEYFIHWEKGWNNFIQKIIDTGYLGKIIINKAYYAHKTSTSENLLPEFTKENIDTANIFLDSIYSRIYADIPHEQFICFPDELLCADENHKWGKSPVHYIKLYYLSLIGDIQKRF